MSIQFLGRNNPLNPHFLGNARVTSQWAEYEDAESFVDVCINLDGQWIRHAQGCEHG